MWPRLPEMKALADWIATNDVAHIAARLESVDVRPGERLNRMEAQAEKMEARLLDAIRSAFAARIRRTRRRRPTLLQLPMAHGRSEIPAGRRRSSPGTLLNDLLGVEPVSSCRQQSRSTEKPSAYLYSGRW